MRLAWFSPWPPQPSGIAGRSAELTAGLAARGYAIDVFVDEQDARAAARIRRAPAEAPQPGAIRVQSAHDFVWRAARGQYDLNVYQLGNSRLHEYIWPYLFQYPGLAILHDARLHHARARALLRRKRFDEYRAEFVYNHPELSVDLAELGVRGLDGLYYYQWPMTRAVLAASRLVACHSPGAAEELGAEHIALGEGMATPDLPAMRARFRSAHSIDPDVVLFGVHGALTAGKRVPQILRAFAAIRQWIGRAELLLAGRPDPALDLEAEIDRLRIRDRVHIVEQLDDEAFDEAVAATDIGLNLRWPSALEVSGPWVRALALSRPTVIVDLPHLPVPSLDPRTWRRHAPCEELGSAPERRAIAVAIDILDEEHSLRLAMRRLAVDAPLCDQLGRRAREWWEREHTVARMVNDFERIAAMAAEGRSGSEASVGGPLPAHLQPDPEAWANALVQSFDARKAGL